jgi:hypothetical protein
MEKSIARRVNILYWSIIVVVAVMLTWQLGDFVTGFSQGMSLSDEYLELHKQGRTMYAAPLDVKEYYTAEGADAYKHLVAHTPDSSITVMARVATYGVRVEHDENISNPYAWMQKASVLLLIVEMVIYVMVLVFLFKTLSDIKRSMKRGTVFSRRVVRYARWTGILMIVCVVGFDVAVWLQGQYVLSLVEICDADLASTYMTGSPVKSMVSIVVGLLVLFFAEVLGIGYDMSEEQKLTI